jgi:hypothetical protein
MSKQDCVNVEQANKETALFAQDSAVVMMPKQDICWDGIDQTFHV